MQRPRRLALATCGMALTLQAAAGCKNTRPEVPPPPAFAPTGDPNRPVGFGSDPSPPTGNPYGIPGGNNVGGAARANPYNPLPGAPPSAVAPQGPPQAGPVDPGPAASPVEALPPMQSIRGEAKPDDGGQPVGTMGRGDSGPAPN